MGLREVGKFLLLIGGLTAGIGLLFLLLGSLPGQFPLGRLPGDIRVERPGFSFYFPLATSLLISLILTILLNVLFRMRR